MCSPEPSDGCKLKMLCLDRRTEFLDSVRTLADAKREESKWLRDRVHLLEVLQGMLMLAMVGGSPGNFGDIIIFWEVPAHWLILTRDKTFSLLQSKHRPEVSVSRIRLPRTEVDVPCEINTLFDKRFTTSGVLKNFNALGACVAAPERIGRKGTQITLKATPWPVPRHGRITRAQRELGRVIHGIRIPAGQACLSDES